MSDMTRQSGWQNLSNGFDVELQHGIPVRLSNNGQDIPSDDAELVEEVSRLSGLTVVVSGWVDADEPGEQETRLCVDALQFEDVLHRLALASAALFVDRYHTAIDKDSVDWDNAEYARDFNHAVECCCMEPGEVDQQDYFDSYVTLMHEETQRLLDAGETPMVDAESDP